VILSEDLQNFLEFPKIMFSIGSLGNIFQEIFATSSMEMHNAVFKTIWVTNVKPWSVRQIMVKYEHLINVDILKRLKKYTVYINCLNVIFFFDFYNSMLSATFAAGNSVLFCITGFQLLFVLYCKCIL
jgi:hypothetical protein